MRSGRNDLESEQNGRPEHKGISAASKNPPRKVAFAERSGKRDPRHRWGRPLTQMKKQVNAVCGTAGVRDQASKERFSEIRSGRTLWQQGLVATYRDSRNEVN